MNTNLLNEYFKKTKYFKFSHTQTYGQPLGSVFVSTSKTEKIDPSESDKPISSNGYPEYTNCFLMYSRFIKRICTSIIKASKYEHRVSIDSKFIEQFILQTSMADSPCPFTDLINDGYGLFEGMQTNRSYVCTATFSFYKSFLQDYARSDQKNMYNMVERGFVEIGYDYESEKWISPLDFFRDSKYHKLFKLYSLKDQNKVDVIDELKFPKQLTDLIEFTKWISENVETHSLLYSDGWVSEVLMTAIVDLKLHPEDYENKLEAIAKMYKVLEKHNAINKYNYLSTLNKKYTVGFISPDYYNILFEVIAQALYNKHDDKTFGWVLCKQFRKYTKPAYIASSLSGIPHDSKRFNEVRKIFENQNHKKGGINYLRVYMTASNMVNISSARDMLQDASPKTISTIIRSLSKSAKLLKGKLVRDVANSNDKDIFVLNGFSRDEYAASLYNTLLGIYNLDKNVHSEYFKTVDKLFSNLVLSENNFNAIALLFAIVYQISPEYNFEKHESLASAILYLQGLNVMKLKQS